jgi:hypothetical protein
MFLGLLGDSTTRHHGRPENIGLSQSAQEFV